MRAPGDIGWNKYRKLMRDAARRAWNERSRNRRYSERIRLLGSAAAHAATPPAS